MKTDYQKLKEIIDEIDVLIGKSITKTSPEFQAWHTKAERFLSKKYGVDSIELNRFSDSKFSSQWYFDNYEPIVKCKEGLMATKLTFEEYLKEMQEETERTPEIQQSTTYDKVFIVHGHDGELKEAVARIIEKQGIEAIILSEKVNQGRTIIEKFENYSNVAGAVCLFTADDVGNKKSEAENTEPSFNPRARQNVVFETGFFMGQLGRDHVVILADKGVEMPSDLSGVVYTNTANWQFDLIKELNAMGYTVDANKLL